MKKINPKILVVTIVGVIALLGVGGYFVPNNNSDKDDAPVTALNANTSKTTTETKDTPTLAGKSTEE